MYCMHRCCTPMAAEQPSLGEHQPSHCGRDTRERHQLGFPDHHHQRHPPAPTRSQGLLVFFTDLVCLLRTENVVQIWITNSCPQICLDPFLSFNIKTFFRIRKKSESAVDI